MPLSVPEGFFGDLYGFRFTVRFFLEEATGKLVPLPDAPLAYHSIGTTERGFVVWKAVHQGKPTLMQLIGEADRVVCTAYGRNEDDKGRVPCRAFEFALDKPKHLPMAVDPCVAVRTIRGSGMALDATEDCLLMEGVVFQHWELLGVTDDWRALDRRAGQ
jgi:hypothetical protein